jgi:hypothetical protein
MAQRHHVQKAQRMEKPLVLFIFLDLDFERLEIRQNVAVRDGHALRLRSRAGGKQNLGDGLAIKRRRRIRLARMSLQVRRQILHFQDGHRGACRQSPFA